MNHGCRIVVLDDAYSSTGTGLERTGSLGWTEEAGGQDLRMPNCLWRDRTTAGRSPGSDWNTSLQKQRRRRGRRGLGPWPLRCQSQIIFRERRERCRMMSLGVQFFFAYLLPWGWLSFYNVSCSQFEGCRDSLSLDKIFPAFIE